MSEINKNELLSDEEEDEENSDDEQEEEINILEQVQGLFSSDIFSNVIEMFRIYQTQFDLIKFLQIHQIVSQYDYIRLINYIRREVSLSFNQIFFIDNSFEYLETIDG
jgi:hypothetical protein